MKNNFLVLIVAVLSLAANIANAQQLYDSRVADLAAA